MRIRMQRFWRRNVTREVGQILDSETLQPDPDFATPLDEIRYHLDAGHAVPVVGRGAEIVRPVEPEVRVEATVETPAPASGAVTVTKPPAKPRRRRRK